MLLLLSALGGAPAAAQVRAQPETPPEPQRAEDLFRKGRNSYDLGRYDEAITLFQRSYEMSGEPLLLYNIGQAYRMKGDCPRAREAYEVFVRRAEKAPRPEDYRRELTRATARLRPLRDQCPASPAPPAEASKGPDLTAPRPPPPPPAVLVAPAEPAPPPRLRQGLAIGSAAGAVALGGVATWALVSNGPRQTKWRREDAVLEMGPPAGQDAMEWIRRQEANDELSRSISRRDRLGWGMAAAAGALAVTAAILYFTGGSHPSGSDRPTGAPSP
jgi:tetratricopeptide (TPR) repeat protein